MILQIIDELATALFWATVGGLGTFWYIQHNFYCMENMNHLFDWLSRYNLW